MLADFVDRMGEADAALGVGTELLELALAASAGVDLRLDHPQRPGELLRGRHGLFDAHRRIAGRHGHAELREQLFGLIFVDVHRAALSRLAIAMQSAGRSGKSRKSHYSRVRPPSFQRRRG
jgi:hypothetical protein